MVVLSLSSVPWCGKFDRAIDYQLVKVEKPACIEEMNGCGNCRRCRQKSIREVERR